MSSATIKLADADGVFCHMDVTEEQHEPMLIVASFVSQYCQQVAYPAHSLEEAADIATRLWENTEKHYFESE